MGVLFRPLLANLRVAALTILKRNWIFKLLFVILLQTIEGLRDIDTVLRVIRYRHFRSIRPVSTAAWRREEKGARGKARPLFEARL